MLARLLGLSVVLSLLASCSAVFSGSPSRESLIDEFLDKSYLRQEVTRQHEKMALLQSGRVIRPGSEAEAKLERELEKAIRLESMVALMHSYLSKERIEIVEQLVEWLRTPLAQRMLALAAEPFDYTAFTAYKVRKDEPLYQLIPRLDKATHTTELTIEDEMEKAKRRGQSCCNKDYEVPSEYKLSLLTDEYQVQLLRKQAFLYRRASSRDLEGYVAFLESTLGQTYISLRRNALVVANSKVQTVWAKMMTPETQPQTQSGSGYVSITEKQMLESKYNAEKDRSLSFQRLLAMEEKRAGGLEAQVKRISEELKTLREQCPQRNLP